MGCAVLMGLATPESPCICGNCPPTCEVCGVIIRHPYQRCTNMRCLTCHARWCSRGGADVPGHGRRWPEGHRGNTGETAEGCPSNT